MRNNDFYRVYLNLNDDRQGMIEGKWYTATAVDAIACAQETAKLAGIEFSADDTWSAIPCLAGFRTDYAQVCGDLADRSKCKIKP